jgi:hypothetical protein
MRTGPVTLADAQWIVRFAPTASFIVRMVSAASRGDKTTLDSRDALEGPLSVGVFALVSVTKLIVVCCSTVARTNSKRPLSVDCGAAPSRRPPGKSEPFVPLVTMLVLSFAKPQPAAQLFCRR